MLHQFQRATSPDARVRKTFNSPNWFQYTYLYMADPSSSVDRELNSPAEFRVPASPDLQEELFRKTVGIAAAAHELKTPLSLLSGYTKILLDGSLGTLNEQQLRVLKEMDIGATRLQRFVNDFLAFGALESGRLQSNRKSQSVNEVVREVIQIWVRRFEAEKKVLTFLPGTDLPLAFFDELKVQHVLSNLLDNALKFTPENGQVTVTTRGNFWERRQISKAPVEEVDHRREHSRRDNSVRIDVRDTGPGIPAEHHLEVFDEFERLRSNRNSEGIGLGLAIAKRLIDAQGGKIWIESGSCPGAIFSFLLPTS
jgi:signal transduction histidine kinase